MMTKDQLAALLVEIGGGTPVIGEEANKVRRNAESGAFQEAYEKYWGIVSVLDAANSFYSETLHEIADRLPAIKSLKADTFFRIQWHMVVSSRCFTSFDLLMRGHYNDAAALARGLWETALHLVALNRGISTRSDYVTGTSGTVKTQLTRRAFTEHFKQLDSRVQQALIWKHKNLTDEARREVEVFHDIVNAATHKSMLSLAWSHVRVRRKEPLYIFPQFDPQPFEGISNIVLVATWCLMSTLTHLEPAVPPPDSAWRERHGKLMNVFDETVGKGPNKLVKHFNEVVQQLFY